MLLLSYNFLFMMTSNDTVPEVTDPINERLLVIEQCIAHILTKLDQVPAKKRNTTFAQLDAKLNTILERLPVQGTYIF